MSCVTFSALNSIEIQEKFLTGSQTNYSDRFIAKMSDTMRNGNYLWKVADTIRNIGLVKDEDYPTPLSYTWDEYHAAISEPLLTKLKEKGKQWLSEWEISYEWIDVTPENLAHHLKHAPLQVVIPGHAVVDILNPRDISTYFDSYAPFIKTVQTSTLQAALKIVLKKKTTMNNEFVSTIKQGGKVGIVLWADTPENYKYLCKMHKVEPKVQADGSIQTDISL